MTGPAALVLRHATEADFGAVHTRLDEWWGGRRMRARFPRLWFRHFGGTSWIADTADGRLAGFLVAFVSPDRGDLAQVYLIGVDPNHRREGIGRALYEHAFDTLRRVGVSEVEAVTTPDDRIAIAFHRALGFTIDDGDGTTRLYGTPAIADYDGDGEDRVRLTRTI